MFKKIISSVAALAMVGSLAVIPVSAGDDCFYTLDSGRSFTDTADEYGGQYFTVNFADVLASSDVYVLSGLVKLEISNGTIGTDADNYEYAVVSGADTKTGLYIPGRTKSYGVGPTVVAQTNALNIAWATSKATTSDDGMLFEAYVTPTDPTKDLKITISGDSYIQFCDKNVSAASKRLVNFDSTYEKEYVLKAGTSTIEEYSETPVVTTYAVTAGEGIASVDKTEAAAGETVNFVVADAPAGKQLADITVNGTSIGKEATSFEMPAEAATVAATFEDIPAPKYAVTAGEGIASVDKAEAEEGETVNFVVADAPAGKQLAGITVNGTAIDKDATSFVMPAEAATVAATFEDIPAPQAVVEFTSDEVTANNAVGFWSKLSAFENAGTVTEAGFVFANVDEVGKDLQTSQIKVADELGLAETITYEFKNLTGYDQFGLKAMAYVVTEQGTFWSAFFGSLIDIVK